MPQFDRNQVGSWYQSSLDDHAKNQLTMFVVEYQQIVCGR